MGNTDLRCWSSPLCPLWPVMSFLKGLRTAMPRGKVLPDGWPKCWLLNQRGFDVPDHLVLRSQVCLIKSRLLAVPVCTDCTAGSKFFTVFNPLKYSPHPYCTWFCTTRHDIHTYLSLLPPTVLPVQCQQFVELLKTTSSINSEINDSRFYVQVITRV